MKWIVFVDIISPKPNPVRPTDNKYWDLYGNPIIGVKIMRDSVPKITPALLPNRLAIVPTTGNESNPPAMEQTRRIPNIASLRSWSYLMSGTRATQFPITIPEIVIKKLDNMI